MAESKVNRSNYIVIQGWMLTDLELKGNELILYACIFGFSQSENQSFTGSLQYLADWTNSTKQGVSKSLKSLVEKGYLEKTDKTINGVKFCEYRATMFNGVCNKDGQGMQQSLMGGIQQSLTNNISLDNLNNNIADKKEKESKGSSFDRIISEYSNNPEVVDLLKEWLKVRKAKRAAMTDRAIQMNIAKLDKLATASNMTVVEYLQEVICRGWAAFYEIKQYNQQQKQTGSNGNVFLELAEEAGIF